MNEWEEWRRAALLRHRQQEAEKSPPPAPRKTKERREIIRRVITADELRYLSRLQRVSLGMDRGAKRFLAKLEKADPDTQITERQGWYILVLAYKYRRQLRLPQLKKPPGYQ